MRGKSRFFQRWGAEEATVDRPGNEGDVVLGGTGRGQGSSGCVQDRSSRHGLSSVLAELMRFRMNPGVFLIFQLQRREYAEFSGVFGSGLPRLI